MKLTKGDGFSILRRAWAVITTTGAAVLICSVAGWSQTYFEASGQTAVFKLAAGEKSNAAIRDVARLRPGSALHMATVKGGILITLSQRGFYDIAIYDMAGRQAYAAHRFNAQAVRIDTRAFAPGIYNALFRINGQNYSRRFAVSR
jgi:hypothetical protein